MSDATDKRADPVDPRDSTTVLAVSDIQASVDYFVDALGFTRDFIYGDPPFYAGVFRGPVAIHLQGPKATERPAGGGSVYLFCGDARAAHAEFTERGARVTASPEARDYGLVDFIVLDPDGNQLIWASDVEAAAGSEA